MSIESIKKHLCAHPSKRGTTPPRAEQTEDPSRFGTRCAPLTNIRTHREARALSGPSDSIWYNPNADGMPSGKSASNADLLYIKAPTRAAGQKHKRTGG